MNKRLLLFSLLLSVTGIVITLAINFQIAATYLKSDGKTKALFGIIETGRFGYQYYALLFGAAGLFLALRHFRKNNITAISIIALLISIGQICFVWMRIWRLLI